VTSGRDGYQQPEAVIDALGLEPGAHVAEIGAGDGYWIPWLARAVGPEGRVYAVEVEPEKIEVLEGLVAEEGFDNVDVILGEYEDPLLPDGSIDLAITSLTYHHIENRVDYFHMLLADLATGGRVAHLDNRVGMPFPISLWTSGHASEAEDVDSEMTRAGYSRIESFEFLYPQIFLVYAPTSARH
jgi:SAM-dependent methyltransferase